MRCRRTTLIYQQWWYYIWLSGSHNLPQLRHVQDVDKAALYVSRQTLWPSLCIVLPKQVIFLEQSFFLFLVQIAIHFARLFPLLFTFVIIPVQNLSYFYYYIFVFVIRPCTLIRVHDYFFFIFLFLSSCYSFYYISSISLSAVGLSMLTMKYLKPMEET